MGHIKDLSGISGKSNVVVELEGKHLVDETIVIEDADDLTIIGKGGKVVGENQDGPLLRFKNCRNVNLRGVGFTSEGSSKQRGPNGSVLFEWCNLVSVSDCQFRGGNGVSLGFIASVDRPEYLNRFVYEFRCTNNRFTVCQKSVLIFGPCFDSIVSNNQFSSCNVGVMVDDRSTQEIFKTGHQPCGVNIFGNTLSMCSRRPSSAAIRVTAAQDVMIHGNIINDNGIFNQKASFGILVNHSTKAQSENKSKNVQVFNNQINRPRGYSLSLKGEDVWAKGNRVSEPYLEHHIKEH